MYLYITRSALALALGFASFTAAAADGDLDTSYGVNGLRLSGVSDASSQIPAGMAVQPDGKVVICAAEGSSDVDFYVVRFTTTGDLDTSFSFDGRVTIDFGGNDDACSDIAVQGDGKIVVAGTTIAAGTSDFAVARLNPDGTLDTAGFGAGTGKSIVGFDLGGTNADGGAAVALTTTAKSSSADMPRPPRMGSISRFCSSIATARETPRST
jgi:uncharacterized delta-60 repeat protein